MTRTIQDNNKIRKNKILNNKTCNNNLGNNKVSKNVPVLSDSSKEDYSKRHDCTTNKKDGLPISDEAKNLNKEEINKVAFKLKNKGRLIMFSTPVGMDYLYSEYVQSMGLFKKMIFRMGMLIGKIQIRINKIRRWFI